MNAVRKAVTCATNRTVVLVNPSLSLPYRQKSTNRIMARKRCPTCIYVGDRENFQNLFNAELKALKDVCTRQGIEIRLAGGAVRDLLLDKVPHDLDFATTTLPDEMVKKFTEAGVRVLDYGSKAAEHGTVTVRINDLVNYEISTTRSDVVCNERREGVNFHQDWEKDAKRRDLTINSMFLDLDGTVEDYCNGYEDLKNRRILFVEDAEKRIQEDYLRILRYFRFYGRIKTETDTEGHDQSTLEAIRKNASGLDGVAGERIWVELKKIVKGNLADNAIKHIVDLGLAEHIGLPADCNTSEFSAVYKRAKDSGCFETVSESALVASLLTSTSQVEVLHKRLKPSRLEYNTMLFIVAQRSDYHHSDIKFYQDQILYSPNAKVHCANCMQLASYMADRKLYDSLLDWSTSMPTMPFSGKVLIKEGVPKGKRIAAYLIKVKKHWQESDYKATSEELTNYAKKLIEEEESMPEVNRTTNSSSPPSEKKRKEEGHVGSSVVPQ